MKLPVMMQRANKVQCVAVVQEAASQGDSAGCWSAQTLLMQVLLSLPPNYSELILQGLCLHDTVKLCEHCILLSSPV